LNNSIILFDGVCNLCNGFVRFIIKHDSKAVFKFAALQSAAGKALLARHNLAEDLQSVILVQDSKVYTQSAAVLRIATQLGFWWKLSYVFFIVPPFIRNAVYHFIAKHRLKFFGKSETCMIPTPETESRFLN
jgi:predicted DCC family thiol-disulfide oxidoreductase YuxK